MATKPTVPDLKELFKQAAEIAKQVPESMQEAAFNRAVDLLTQGLPEKDTIGGSSGKEKNRPKKSLSKNEDSDVNAIDELLSKIDSTQHPGVAAASRVLDRALMVLQIARTEHGIDGLTPPQIAKILTEKFRLGTKYHSVSMALGKSTNYVNRVAEGSGYKYRIMSPGEEYLAHLETDGDASQNIPAKKPRKNKKKASPSKAPSASPKSNRKSGNRPGPKQFLERLIADRYFDTKREISSIISHIQDTHAHTYKATDLSPTLIRLLREGKLERTKNEQGRYEYSTKS